MNAKFSLTSETITHFGTTLYRIKAEKDFGNVKKGDLGGFVEKESNIEVSGNAWVYGDARVSGDAQVSGNAQVYGDAFVSGNAWVYGNARVYGDAQVSGNAQVYGDAQVYGNAQVYGKIKFEFGWCFGRKRNDWNVTELENGEEILLIKDYKPAIEYVKPEPKEVTMEELSALLGYEVKIKK